MADLQTEGAEEVTDTSLGDATGRDRAGYLGHCVLREDLEQRQLSRRRGEALSGDAE